MILTPRQQQCADLLAEGLSNKAIAKRLGLSPSTVRMYLIEAYAKGVPPRRASMRGNRNAVTGRAKNVVVLDGQTMAPRHALRAARAEAGVYQHHLSMELRCAHDSVRKWERGQQDPATESWVSAMNALGYRVVLERVA